MQKTRFQTKESAIIIKSNKPVMATRDKTTSALKVGNLKEALANKQIISILTFRMKEGGECCYVIDDKEVPASDIEAKYPTEFKPIRKKGENVDGTKIE